MNGLQRHRRVEGEAREDRGLLRGVVTLDIRRRISLGVPERLRLREDLTEIGALGVHPVEDVVGRAVDDAHDALHPVAGERIAQGPDDGNRARRCSLVVDLRADLVGGLEDLGAVRGKQRLVGGHDICARTDCLQQVRAGRLDPAHQFDDDVGTEDEGLGIRREQLARQVGVARRIRIAHGDAHEFEAGSGAVCQFVGVLTQQRGDLGADGPGAQQRDAEAAIVGHAVLSVGRMPASRASRSSMVSPRTITRERPAQTATTAVRGR